VPGGCLRIGKVLIGVQDLRLRCIMTSYDPDTLVQDKEVTRSIYRCFDGKLALNCFVIEGGEITVDDEVQLVRGRACAESAAASVFATNGKNLPFSFSLELQIIGANNKK